MLTFTAGLTGAGLGSAWRDSSVAGSALRPLSTEPTIGIMETSVTCMFTAAARAGCLQHPVVVGGPLC